MTDAEETLLLDTDDMYRLLAEVTNKVPVEDSTLPDTPAVRRTRAILEVQVAEIVAKGYTVDVPHEW